MRLYVFDVDGTLIENYKRITRSSIKTINKHLDNGDAIAIASGRPFGSIKKLLNKFHKGKKFAICANGAALCDFKGNTLYESTIPYQVLLQQKEKFEGKLGKTGEVYCYIKHNLGVFSMNFFSLNEIKINKMPKTNLNKHPLKDDDRIYKVMVASHPTISKDVRFDDEIYEKYHVVRTAPYFLEIMNKEVDKSRAVKELADILKVNYKDVYCFGDEENDLLMIKNFNGVAMGNAVDSVKEVANYITKSVSEDGVSYAINELIK